MPIISKLTRLASVKARQLTASVAQLATSASQRITQRTASVTQRLALVSQRITQRTGKVASVGVLYTALYIVLGGATLATIALPSAAHAQTFTITNNATGAVTQGDNFTITMTLPSATSVDFGWLAEVTGGFASITYPSIGGSGFEYATTTNPRDVPLLNSDKILMAMTGSQTSVTINVTASRTSTDPIVIAFTPDSDSAPSASFTPNNITQNVDPAPPPTLTLTSNASSVIEGENVTFTASVPAEAIARIGFTVTSSDGVASITYADENGTEVTNTAVSAASSAIQAGDTNANFTVTTGTVANTPALLTFAAVTGENTTFSPSNGEVSATITARPVTDPAAADLRLHLSSGTTGGNELAGGWQYAGNINVAILPPSGTDRFDGTGRYTLRVTHSGGVTPSASSVSIFDNGTATFGTTTAVAANAVTTYNIAPRATARRTSLTISHSTTHADAEAGLLVFDILNDDGSVAVTNNVTVVDRRPIFSLTTPKNTYAEGENLEFTIGLFAGQTAPAVVDNEVYLLWLPGTGTGTPAFLNGTVFATSDFNGAQSVIVKAGDTNANVTLPIKTGAGNRDFRLRLLRQNSGGNQPANYPITAYSTDSPTIQRFAVRPPFTVTLTPAEANITEGASDGSESQEFTVTLSESVTTASTVSLIKGGDAASRRYTISPSPLMIPGGSTEGKFTVTAVDDNIFDGDQNATIMMSASVDGAVYTNSSTVMISDDETGPPVVSMSCPAEVQVQTTFTCSITRTGSEFPANQQIFLGVSGSPVANLPIVTFPAGSATSHDFELTGDSTDDTADLVVTISASAANKYTLGTASATIDLVTFGATLPTSPTIDEGMSGTIALGISSPQTTASTVRWQTRGAGADGAVAANDAIAGTGQDYTMSGGGAMLANGNYTGTATIAAGDTNVNLTITALQNTIFERGANRRLILNTTTTVGGTNYTAETQVGLVDDDDAPTYSIAAVSNTGGAGRNSTITITNDNSRQSRFATNIAVATTGAAAVYDTTGNAVGDATAFDILYP
ncbi:MAG: hypothetical protein MJE68_17070, partial [Proteobacteria bacterium]|nr:hypothetical protein [Pseudomonadota bacterium]